MSVPHERGARPGSPWRTSDRGPRSGFQPERADGRRSPRAAEAEVARSRAPSPTLADVYRAHVDFVDRVARHLKVPPAQLDDVVHDVFLVVHRRLPEFDGAGSLRSWLYGITRRVVMHHQRSARRLRARHERFEDVARIDARRRRERSCPSRALERSEAARAVERFLDSLDEDKRMVFALIDIEGLSAPEVARALGVKLNTVYSRLRAARRRFEQSIARPQASATPGDNPPQAQEVDVQPPVDELSPDARLALAAYRDATRVPSPRRDALWSRLEADVAADVAPDIPVDDDRERRPRVVWIGAALALAAAALFAVIWVGGQRPSRRSSAGGEATQHAAPYGATTHDRDRRVSDRRAVPGVRARASGTNNMTLETSEARGDDAPELDAAPTRAPSTRARPAPTREPSRRPTADAPPTPEANTTRGSSSPPTLKDKDENEDENEDEDEDEADPNREPTHANDEEDGDDLARELALLGQARAALRAHDPSRALELLDRHQRTFDDGQLVEDRLALRVETLCELGKRAQARAERRAFLARYPRSPHAARVRCE